MADTSKNSSLSKRRTAKAAAGQWNAGSHPHTLVVEEAARSTAAEPSSEEIARLAYSYWEARGGQGGSAEEDWARAESELRSRPRTKAASGGATC